MYMNRIALIGRGRVVRATTAIIVCLMALATPRAAPAQGARPFGAHIGGGITGQDDAEGYDLGAAGLVADVGVWWRVHDRLDLRGGGMVYRFPAMVGCACPQAIRAAVASVVVRTDSAARRPYLLAEV